MDLSCGNKELFHDGGKCRIPSDWRQQRHKVEADAGSPFTTYGIDESGVVELRGHRTWVADKSQAPDFTSRRLKHTSRLH